MLAAVAGTIPLHFQSSFPVQRRKCHAVRASFWARWPLARSEDPFQADLSEIRAIAAGDSAAFQRLIDREAPRLIRFAYGMLGNLDDAEDVVQETLIRLFENAASWTPDARIGTWLHRVCYNRAIDVLRRRRAVADESALEELADESDTPDTAIVRSETILSVRDAIERLPARQRTAVLLFHFQDFSQRDAASVMGVSEDAFESMLARARRQLKRLIGDSDGGGDV
jgi:RNA polymerase sigma-70 factor, ECF subfamily